MNTRYFFASLTRISNLADISWTMEKLPQERGFQTPSLANGVWQERFCHTPFARERAERAGHRP